MKNISWRHHYLPVFYLKGFTNESNRFKIFNVKKGDFVKNKKEFSPESYFFEKDSNTITFDNQSDDILETKFYSNFDNKIARLFETINSSNKSDRYGISEKEMPMINHFVSMMYWRLPSKQLELERYIEKHSLKELGLKIVNKDKTENYSLGEDFKNNPNFQKGYKYYNSLLDSIRGINCDTPYTIIETHKELPSLCSDNPILFEKKEYPKVYEDDYIIPLTGNKLFIKSKKFKNFPHSLKILVDTLIFKQAEKYVCCTNEKYIEVLIDNFEKKNLDIDELRKYIFYKINVT